MEEKYKYIIDKYKSIYKITENELISKFTTLNIGGPARIFIEVNNILKDGISLERVSREQELESQIQMQTNDIVSLLNDLKENSINYYILGAGSDVLFSDDLFDGVIIKVTSKDIFTLNKLTPSNESHTGEHMVRHMKLTNNNNNRDLDFESINFVENKENPEYLYADAGVMMPFLIPTTLNKGLTGLQWFSYIPASVGGATYNNIHGGKHMLSEYIEKVILIEESGIVKVLNNKDMEFHYDASRIQKTRELVLGVIFKLYKENEDIIQKAKDFSNKWIGQKANIQPKERSAGSTFKNLTEEQRQQLGLETNAAGYLIQECGLKGYSIGDAQIYINHGNFFINKGRATGKDYKELIDYAIMKVNEKYGIILDPEIKFINFK